MKQMIVKMKGILTIPLSHFRLAPLKITPYFFFVRPQLARNTWLSRYYLTMKWNDFCWNLQTSTRALMCKWMYAWDSAKRLLEIYPTRLRSYVPSFASISSRDIVEEKNLRKQDVVRYDDKLGNTGLPAIGFVSKCSVTHDDHQYILQVGLYANSFIRDGSNYTLFGYTEKTEERASNAP